MTIARYRIRPPLTRSPILTLTISHRRRLLSIARSNIAQSRSRRSRSSKNRMVQLAVASARAWRRQFGPRSMSAAPSPPDHALSVPLISHLPTTIGQGESKPRAPQPGEAWPVAEWLLRLDGSEGSRHCARQALGGRRTGATFGQRRNALRYCTLRLLRSDRRIKNGLSGDAGGRAAGSVIGEAFSESDVDYRRAT